jgi:hypothetical protein
MIWGLEPFSNDSVVVDFAIDCKCNAFVRVGKRLGSTVDSYNTQPLVGKNYRM